MRKHLSGQHDQGFALLEIIVAMVIMAIVGLLAWRGMDAMIRGREVIEQRANENYSYVQLIRQFDRDCQEIISSNELNTASGFSSASVSNSLPSVAVGTKNIWWLRHYRADAQDAWLLVGYGLGPSGLKRWTSQPIMRRTLALALWGSILQEPDLLSNDLLVSWQVPNVVRQSFAVQTSALSGGGASGISTSSTGASPSNTAAANGISSTSNAIASTNLILITPAQQGVVMQWWLKDIALPITRSCLMEGAL